MMAVSSSLKTGISVDLWFCYGSFFYGIESRLYDCNETQLALTLSAAEPEALKELAHFLNSIIDKPRGLLRVELRVYGNEKPAKKSTSSKTTFPVFLFTDTVPRVVSKLDSSLVILCSCIQGISPSNTENWSRFVRQISHNAQHGALKKT